MLSLAWTILTGAFGISGVKGMVDSGHVSAGSGGALSLASITDCVSTAKFEYVNSLGCPNGCGGCGCGSGAGGTVVPGGRPGGSHDAGSSVQRGGCADAEVKGVMTTAADRHAAAATP